MSCSQVHPEFTKEKFALKHPHPSSFCVWRYTCFAFGRSYAIYRILFAALFFVLVFLDYLWIIGFNAVGAADRWSACLDASQFALISLCITYSLLAYTANQWNCSVSDLAAETSIPYRLGWFCYTCSANAVFQTTVLYWVFSATSPVLEPKFKYTIPTGLILLDLMLSSIPLSFCHVIYVILVCWSYLAVCSLGLYLGHVLGSGDEPFSPTVWIAGQPLVPRGIADLSDWHRILLTTFGSAALCLVFHSVLLSLVILRDFLASLFACSTEVWTEAIQTVAPGDADLFVSTTSMTRVEHRTELD